MIKLWLAAATFACVVPQSISTGCISDREIQRLADDAAQALRRGRYQVTTKGLAGPFDFSFAPANFTTSGVNPSSRYIVPRIGPWREGDIGGDSFLNWGIGEANTLTSRQAVVVMMCTPPEVRMWSLEAAVLYRLNFTTSPKPGASISNTENSATMPEAKQDSPLVVVMTADRGTEADVVRAFSGMNLSHATIAINGTADLLNFGVQPLVQECDVFQLCMRVHASAVQSRSDAFREYASRRFPLLLVEPAFAGADQPLYPVRARPTREGPTTEAGLDRRRAALNDAVISRMAAAGWVLALTVPFHAVELNKRRCLVDRNYHPYTATGNCYGTSSDGRYALSDAYTLPEGNMTSLVVVATGANHVATGNAADNQLLHNTNVAVNPEGLHGSAEFILGASATPADAGLFAFAFAQRCTAPWTEFCAVVPAQSGGKAGALLRLEAYLDNESGTRPSAGLVHPTALVFHRRDVRVH